MINKENFKEKLAEVNIILTDHMLEQFDLYFKLIDKYNKVMDLTAISSEDEIYDRLENQRIYVETITKNTTRLLFFRNM